MTPPHPRSCKRPPMETRTDAWQRCATVDVDNNLVIDSAADTVKSSVLEHLDVVASFTGTDIFLLGPKLEEAETIGTTFNGSPEISLDQRLRVAIYGDTESVEHAKTRVLIMIDQIVRLLLFLSLFTTKPFTNMPWHSSNGRSMPSNLKPRCIPSSVEGLGRTSSSSSRRQTRPSTFLLLSHGFTAIRRRVHIEEGKMRCLSRAQTRRTSRRRSRNFTNWYGPSANMAGRLSC